MTEEVILVAALAVIKAGILFLSIVIAFVKASARVPF